MMCEKWFIDQNLFNRPIHKFKLLTCYSSPVKALRLELIFVFIHSICMVILMKMLIECFMALSAYALLCTQAFEKQNASLTLKSMVFLESVSTEQSILCMGHKTVHTHFHQYHHTILHWTFASSN